MQKTKIDYLTHTWNPICMRCTPVSPGCQNCWHLKMADRFAANLTLTNQKRDIYAGLGKFMLDEKELEAPLKLKKPARIGVQFMGDLFHEAVLFEFIDKVYEVIRRSSQHTFLVLTKRPECMAQYQSVLEDYPKNLWLGVTAENQEMADKRIPILLPIPTDVRFVSCEPLLEQIDFSNGGNVHYLRGYPGVGLVVVGCESGAHRRYCNNEWILDICNHCQNAGVPVFVKQITGADGKVLKSFFGWPRQFPKGD